MTRHLTASVALIKSSLPLSQRQRGPNRCDCFGEVINAITTLIIEIGEPGELVTNKGRSDVMADNHPPYFCVRLLLNLWSMPSSWQYMLTPKSGDYKVTWMLGVGAGGEREQERDGLEH